jgi:hypothetical protein
MDGVLAKLVVFSLHAEKAETISLFKAFKGLKETSKVRVLVAGVETTAFWKAVCQHVHCGQVLGQLEAVIKALGTVNAAEAEAESGMCYTPEDVFPITCRQALQACDTTNLSDDAITKGRLKQLMTSWTTCGDGLPYFCPFTMATMELARAVQPNVQAGAGLEQVLATEAGVPTVPGVLVGLMKDIQGMSMAEQACFPDCLLSSLDCRLSPAGLLARHAAQRYPPGTPNRAVKALLIGKVGIGKSTFIRKMFGSYSEHEYDQMYEDHVKVLRSNGKDIPESGVGSKTRVEMNVERYYNDQGQPVATKDMDEKSIRIIIVDTAGSEPIASGKGAEKKIENENVERFSDFVIEHMSGKSKDGLLANCFIMAFKGTEARLDDEMASMVAFTGALGLPIIATMFKAYANQAGGEQLFRDIMQQYPKSVQGYCMLESGGDTRDLGVPFGWHLHEMALTIAEHFRVFRVIITDPKERVKEARSLINWHTATAAAIGGLLVIPGVCEYASYVNTNVMLSSIIKLYPADIQELLTSQEALKWMVSSWSAAAAGTVWIGLGIAARFLEVTIVFAAAGLALNASLHTALCVGAGYTVVNALESVMTMAPERRMEQLKKILMESGPDNLKKARQGTLSLEALGPEELAVPSETL